ATGGRNEHHVPGLQQARSLLTAHLHFTFFKEDIRTWLFSSKTRQSFRRNMNHLVSRTANTDGCHGGRLRYLLRILLANGTGNRTHPSGKKLAGLLVKILFLVELLRFNLVVTAAAQRNERAVTQANLGNGTRTSNDTITFIQRRAGATTAGTVLQIDDRNSAARVENLAGLFGGMQHSRHAAEQHSHGTCEVTIAVDHVHGSTSCQK